MPVCIYVYTYYHFKHIDIQTRASNLEVQKQMTTTNWYI